MTSPLPRPGAAPALRDTLGLRLALVLGAIVVAYHYSLQTLFSTLGLETPLAYLGLVPLIALGLVAAHARPRTVEPDIHDRELDLIVGLPLVVTALAVTLLLPDRMSTLFWVYRIDVLSLPVFVAGVVTLVFGLRVTWRLKVPIAFLLLAWPPPYNLLVDRGLEPATGLTLSALKAVVANWAVATPIPGSDGSLFSIGQGVDAFTVSVASACAGVNSVVGFLLVGLGFTSVVRGRRASKLAWVTTGIVLIWLLNVARLLLIFWVGGTFGERAAIDGLHPFIGLVLFCLGVLLMLWMMPLFRLSLDLTPVVRAADRPSWLQRTHRRLSQRVPGARGMRAAGVVVLVAASVLSISNAGLSRYGLVVGDLGTPRLVAFLDQPADVPAFSGAQIANYPWAARFFGTDSSWDRFLYSPFSAAAASSSGGAAGAPLVVDVVSTESLRALGAYDVEACYRFHGFDVKAKQSFALAGGVSADFLTYRSTQDSTDWNALFWVWPVQQADGGRHFERIVVLQSADAGLVAPNPDAELSRSEGSSPDTGRTAAPADGAAAAPLVAFADALIRSRPGTPDAPVSAAGRG